jgi:hypothetical protein
LLPTSWCQAKVNANTSWIIATVSLLRAKTGDPLCAHGEKSLEDDISPPKTKREEKKRNNKSLQTKKKTKKTTTK